MPLEHAKYRMPLEHTKYSLLLRHTMIRVQNGGVRGCGGVVDEGGPGGRLDEMASVLIQSNVYFTEFKFVLSQGTHTHAYKRVNYRPGEIDVNPF